MREFSWSFEKNNLLKADSDRHVCFEDIAVAIESGGLLAYVEHTNKVKYPHQRMFVVLLSGYVYAVPYLRQEDGRFFLKTAYPSRYMKRLYLAGDTDEK